MRSYCAEGHLVLLGVDQLDIAKGVGRLTNHAGDAFISLLADPVGHLTAVP